MGARHQLSQLTFNPCFLLLINNLERIWMHGKISSLFFLTKSSPSAKRISFRHFHISQRAIEQTARNTLPHFRFLPIWITRFLNMLEEDSRGGKETPPRPNLFPNVVCRRTREETMVQRFHHIITKDTI